MEASYSRCHTQGKPELTPSYLTGKPWQQRVPHSLSSGQESLHLWKDHAPAHGLQAQNGAKMWPPISPAAIPNGACPNQNKHSASQAARTGKKKRLEVLAHMSLVLSPLWHLLQRAWGPPVACRAARSQTAVPGRGFKLRNGGLRTQGNPCEGTDVLDKSHYSLNSNTRYHPVLPMTCPCWHYPPLPEPSLFTKLPFPFHPLLSFSSTALPFPYLVLVSPRRAHDMPTLTP